MSGINTEQLVERLKSGEKSAFDELYRHYSGQLTKIVMQQGLSEFDAQDVVSDTFEIVMKKIQDQKDPSKFDLWIKKIAKRKAWEAKKKLSKRQDLPTGTDDITDQEQAIERKFALTHEDTVKLPLDYAENEEVKQILAEQIESLSKDLKEALVLFYYQCKTIAEIAKLTGTNENNVKQRLYAARKKLKASIEKLQKSGVVLRAVPIAKLISFFAKNFDISMDIGSVERDAASAGGYDETTLKSDGRVHNTGEDIIRHQASAARRRLILHAVSGICAGAVLCFGLFNFINSSKEPDPDLPDDSQGIMAVTTIENETSATSTTIATDKVNSTSVSSETTAETPGTTTTTDTVAALEEESTDVQEQPTEDSDDSTDDIPDTPETPDAEEPAVQEPQPEQPAAAATKTVVKPTLCGDVNGDNVIDIEDAVIIVTYVNEYSDMTWAEYCKQIKLEFNADQSLANADTYRASDKREITKEDASAILGYINGEYPELPINKL